MSSVNKYHRIGCIVIVLCHLLSLFWSNCSIVKSSLCNFYSSHFPRCFVPQRKLPDKSWDYGVVRSCVGNMTNMANVGNNGTPTVGSVEGAGGVVDSGDGGSEGLGLGGGPVLALVRLGHRLVGHLPGSTVHWGSMDDGWS